MSGDLDTITGNNYIAALAGAILGLKAVPGNSWPERAGNLVCGFSMAIYLGPAIVDYLHIVSVRIGYGMNFAVGAAGLVGFGAVMDAIKQTKFGEILKGWLSRKGT